MKMTFQEIRIIATGPCITNQLRDVNTILATFISEQTDEKDIFDIHFTEFGAVMTTVLPVLFKYCYKYCYSDSRKL
jgi:hypothetical protein